MWSQGSSTSGSNSSKSGKSDDNLRRTPFSQVDNNVDLDSKKSNQSRNVGDLNLDSGRSSQSGNSSRRTGRSDDNSRVSQEVADTGSGNSSRSSRGSRGSSGGEPVPVSTRSYSNSSRGESSGSRSSESREPVPVTNRPHPDSARDESESRSQVSSGRSIDPLAGKFTSEPTFSGRGSITRSTRLHNYGRKTLGDKIKSGAKRLAAKGSRFLSRRARDAGRDSLDSSRKWRARARRLGESKYYSWRDSVVIS